jgi:hypothetical protein
MPTYDVSHYIGGATVGYNVLVPGPAPAYYFLFESANWYKAGEYYEMVV